MSAFPRLPRYFKSGVSSALPPFSLRACFRLVVDDPGKGRKWEKEGEGEGPR